MKTNTCKDCLCHLPVCKAECCKQFVIRTIAPSVIKNNSYLEIPVEGLTDDLIHYFKLHRCNINGNKLIFMAKDFEIQPDKTIFYMRCRALTKDNKCMFHNSTFQPKICRTPNKEGELEANASVTPNCLFRGLYEH
jgi:hypothetical protein